MILVVINTIYAIAYIEAWKSQDFNRAWTHDLAISVWHSNQLSYKATDVESWSFVSPKEPVRNEFEVMWNISNIELRMWNQVSYDPRSYESNLCNCIYRSLQKVSNLTGFKPVTPLHWCDALTNWALKPLTLGAGDLWVLRSTWGINVKLCVKYFKD